MKLVKKGQLLDRRAEVIRGDPPAPPLSGPAKCLAGEAFEDSINRLLEESRERFVLVGELLLDWKDSLPHGQFLPTITAAIETGRLRNISRSTANKYMAVAAAIRGGVVAPEDLPKETEAAYLIASLKEPELERARDQGLVSPTATKAALIDFRRSLREPKPLSRSDLKHRRAKLLAELAEIDAMLERLGG